MKLKRDFRQVVVDKKSNNFGFLVVTHKKMVKEGVFKAMEDLRFLARARNMDLFYAVCTNLYEWQFVSYSRTLDLAKSEDFFELSRPYSLYNKDNNYSYGDNELKKVVGIIRALVRECWKQAEKFEQVGECECIDNCDELF